MSDMTSVEKAPVAARAVIDSATVDNITRLKAQWQVEILEYLERKSTDHRDPSHPVVPLTEVQRLITEKRRQSEGPSK